MKVKLEIVKGAFGHRSIYLHDYRIAGEKPWGGGKVVETRWVDAEDLRKALARAESDAAALRLRSCSAEQLDALPVGTVVEAGEIPCYRVPYKRVKAGWRRCRLESRRAFGDVITSASLAKLQACALESEAA